MDIERQKQLEELLKELHQINEFPYNGVTQEKWQDNVIVSVESTKKKQVVRRKR